MCRFYAKGIWAPALSPLTMHCTGSATAPEPSQFQIANVVQFDLIKPNIPCHWCNLKTYLKTHSAEKIYFKIAKCPIKSHKSWSSLSSHHIQWGCVKLSKVAILEEERKSLHSLKEWIKILHSLFIFPFYIHFFIFTF